MTKEQFLQRLHELHLNKKDFSDICGVPYPTINNWGMVRNEKTLVIPAWVEPFLKYYEDSLKYSFIKKELCDQLQNSILDEEK